MKKQFCVLTVLILLGAFVFGADVNQTVQEKFNARGNKFTYTFDITNESDTQVSFFVISPEKKSNGEPNVFYEIKVPANSSNIYSYTVQKKLWHDFSFGVIFEESFSYGGGSAGFYDATKITVTKERFVQYEYVEPSWTGDWGSVTQGQKGTWEGKVSTFSGNYKEYLKQKTEWEKKNLRWIVFNQRNSETNMLNQYDFTGIPITADEKSFVKARIDGFYEEYGVIIEEYLIDDTKEAAGGEHLFNSEKALIGKWEGTYNGQHAVLTIYFDKYKNYLLELEDGYSEKGGWCADPSYINIQSWTTWEIIKTPYKIKGKVLSSDALGTWMKIE